MYVAYTAKNVISTFQYVINTLQYMCACILQGMHIMNIVNKCTLQVHCTSNRTLGNVTQYKG